jgi:hypothetical protein
MSEWYLESSWCRDEVEWFIGAVRNKRAERPVFVVRFRATDHGDWPEVFKDERGHPLTGYDFVRDAEDDNLRLPIGHPRPEDASDSKEFYAAVRKLAGDIVGQLKALKSAEFVVRKPPQPPELKEGECVFLAAAPAEDVDDLRDELAELLRAQGLRVVPKTNPLDADDVHRCAPEWISTCDKFVQILGTRYGKWKHDDTGLVIYQHILAKRQEKPIYVYRAPSVEMSRISDLKYRTFLERFDQDDTGGLENFAARVALRHSHSNGDWSQSVFMMAGPRDKVLEEEIRQLMKELDISVFPFSLSSEAARDVSSIVDEGSFLEVLKRCGAIVLFAGEVKASRDFWLERTVLYMEREIKQKLRGALPPYAVIDAPPPPKINVPRQISVLLKESPSFKDELQSWLRTSSSPSPVPPTEAPSGLERGSLH